MGVRVEGFLQKRRKHLPTSRLRYYRCDGRFPLPRTRRHVWPSFMLAAVALGFLLRPGNGRLWPSHFPCLWYRYCVLINNVLSLFETPDGFKSTTTLLTEDEGSGSPPGSRPTSRMSSASAVAQSSTAAAAPAAPASRHTRTSSRQVDGACGGGAGHVRLRFETECLPFLRAREWGVIGRVGRPLVGLNAKLRLSWVSCGCVGWVAAVRCGPVREQPTWRMV
jgi:hypothetical protein